MNTLLAVSTFVGGCAVGFLVSNLAWTHADRPPGGVEVRRIAEQQRESVRREDREDTRAEAMRALEKELEDRQR